MTVVRRLNHAVLYVRDARASARFYQDVLGMEPIAELPNGVFLRLPNSGNHHDLGLFSIGADASSPSPDTVRLYHLAWQVDSIHDLATAKRELTAAGAYVGESDHGATKSIYAQDPDGHEFEIMFPVPREQWGRHDRDATTAALDLDAEIARFG